MTEFQQVRALFEVVTGLKPESVEMTDKDHIVTCFNVSSDSLWFTVNIGHGQNGGNDTITIHSDALDGQKIAELTFYSKY